MSRADDIFVEMVRDIIDTGNSSEGQLVRPRWEDGTPAHTIKKFGVVSRYDLRDEFPALTLRRTAIKSATSELLWIWQKKSNNIHDLKATIWDEWADESGSIGKAYGYQMSIKYPYKDITPEGLCKAFGENYRADECIITGDPTEYIMASEELRLKRCILDKNSGRYYMDQVDRVLYDLKVSPFSRRILTGMYNFADLDEMHLYPCAYGVTFNVTTDDEGRYVLNAVLNQRSQDILAANNWNVCQYAVLIHMFARCVDMIPGELIQVIADAHIYDRHVPLIEELITRERHPAPTFSLNPDKHDFYEFTEDDIRLDNYVTGEQIRNIPIAV